MTLQGDSAKNRNVAILELSTKPPFRPDDIALQVAGDGGVLMNLTLGSYFRIPRAVCPFWEALAEGGDFEQARARLAEEGSEQLPSREMLESALEIFASTQSPTVTMEATGDIQSHPSGFLISRSPGPEIIDLVLQREVRAANPQSIPDCRPADLVASCAAVAMRVLAREHLALHAAAVRLGDGVLLLTGRSGAGKTTTARAFARHGSSVLSEDLLLTLPTPQGIELVDQAERELHTWSRRAAELLQKAPTAAVEYDSLLAAVRGLPRVQVTGTGDCRVLLLTQRRPGHQQVLLSDLGQTEGIVALLENSFWGSPEPEAWRAHLGRCQAFSQFAGFKRASWPEGHEELGAAARDYKEMVTSKAEAPASGLPANQA